MTDCPPRDLLVDRDDLTRVAQLAAAVIDDPNTSDAMRRDACQVFDDAGFWLCYGGLSGRSVRLVSVGMHWPGFYGQMVDEFLLDLPDRVKAETPAQLNMARHAATLVDRQGYSNDFRLDALHALNEILGSLKGAADDADAEVTS